jgi:ribosomal protein L2
MEAVIIKEKKTPLTLGLRSKPHPQAMLDPEYKIKESTKPQPQVEGSLAGEKSLNSRQYRRLKNSVGKKSTGGRNNMGRITAYHRGGGNKRRYRFIDNLNSEADTLKQKMLSLKHSLRGSPSFISSGGSLAKFSGVKNLTQPQVEEGVYSEVTGVVKSIERDPNRTALIALVYWSTPLENLRNLSQPLSKAKVNSGGIKHSLSHPPVEEREQSPDGPNSAKDLWSEYSYILAPVGLKIGDTLTSLRRLGSLTKRDLIQTSFGSSLRGQTSLETTIIPSPQATLEDNEVKRSYALSRKTKTGASSVELAESKEGDASSYA